MRPVRPSRAAELWYRAELRDKVVAQCRQAGEDVLAGMRAHWPAVADERDRVPGLPSLMAQAAARFGHIQQTAERIAALAAQRNLDEVDSRLSKNFERAVGVDISSYLGPNLEIGKALRAAARANVDLIKSIPEQYLERVRERVTEAFANGERWETLADAIGEIGDVTDSRARLIARDQTSKMNSSFNQLRQTEVGVSRYTWATSRDERVRESHAEMEGSEQRWDDPPVVDEEAVHPGEAINCRCTALPIISFAEEDVPVEGGALEEAA